MANTTTVIGPVTRKVVRSVVRSSGSSGIPLNAVTVSGIPVTVGGIIVTSS